MAIIIILAFMALFILGIPVVVAIAVPALVYVLVSGFPLELMAQRMTYALDSFPLVAVPVFIFVGSLMNQAGITSHIYKFAHTLGGRVPGGLAQVNVIGSLVFSGTSGAALADIGGLGRIEIRAMTRAGFSRAYSAAITGASAVVGPIFPPSIPLIIYGSATSVSMVQLLIGGVMPALLYTALLMITVAWLAYRHNHPRSERWPTVKDLWSTFMPALPALITPLLLVGGMLEGLFTPTEAASITVAYILFITVVFYGGITWERMRFALFDTVKTTSAVLIIVSAAALFGWVMAVEQLPQMFTRSLLSISTDPLMLLLIVNVLLLIVGMFLDSTTATLLVAPLISAPLVLAGVDPVHLGIIFVFNLMIGLLTPPLGLALFLLSDIAKVSMWSVLRAVVPFYLPLFLSLFIITIWPDLTLWLPKLLR
ncbi:TRAP transporter large permease subunit [Pseudoroseomonas wenyumeiae]|uniref:TRAP transporter large permease protein n=1 Tax=Teichococcus wenyumeiae TaxID=2478470 RepID=A0A3A9JJ94_9PROT|nr:TRAP transporter large permease [Pseudoroseomonas wenyumeiae]RKK03826.1 TRAP transporter large permease [Pseudoroseomonas wenyumeiae]RMI16908.1 TRAP transporter large permease subunit [Pseudoroseomonas wenyumeiae]